MLSIYGARPTASTPRRARAATGRSRSSLAAWVWASPLVLPHAGAAAKFSEEAPPALRDRHHFSHERTQRHEVRSPNIKRVASHREEVVQTAPVHAPTFTTR